MAKAKKSHEPPPHTPLLEGRLAERLKQFSASGFGKGMAATAILFITALVLVAGTMGTGALGGLAVNGVMLPDFGAGVVAGFSKMLAFLTTTTLGWGALAAGGLIGSYLQGKRNKEIIAMDNELAHMDEELAKEQQYSKQLERQLATQPQQDMPQQQPPQHQEERPAPVDQKTAEQIYSEGYLNGLKTSKEPAAEPAANVEHVQEQRPQKQNLQSPPVEQSEPAQPPKQHMDQAYSQGYVDGVRMAQAANANLPPSANNNIPSSEQTPANISQYKVEVSAPTINNTLNDTTVNNTLNDNSVSQVAMNSPSTPDSTSLTQASDPGVKSRGVSTNARSVSFAAAELQRQSERELSGSIRTV